MDLTFTEKPARDIRLPETTGITSKHASKLRLKKAPPERERQGSGDPCCSRDLESGERQH